MHARSLRILALLLFFATPLAADTFTLVASGGSWSNNTVWLQNGLPAVRYPGSLAGTVDIVNLTVPLYTVAVDVVLSEGVELHANCPSNTSTCVVDVGAAGLLRTSGGISTITDDAHLKLTGGTIEVRGALSLGVGSKFDWSSGTLTGVGATDIAYDSVDPAILTLVNGILDGHSLTVHGKAIYTGSFGINNGGQVDITTNGIFDIQTLGPITTNNPATSKIVNGGTFEKTGGAGGTNISVPLNNNGIVKAWFGTLVLSDGSHTNGTFDVASTHGLEIAGTFNGTCTIQGAGTTKIVGTPVIENGATLNVNGALSMLGGWLQGPAAGTGVANVSSVVTFDGGAWRRNLTVNMLTASTLDVTGVASVVLDDATVVADAGALVKINPGVSLAINTGSSITNNGTLRLTGDVTVTSDGVFSPFIVNNALLEKTAGAGIARIATKVDNNGTGTISVASGELALNGGGTSSGTINIPAATNQLVFESNTYTLAAGSLFNITDLGWFRVDGGTLSLSAPLTLKFVHLRSGTLRGSTLIINNGLKWNGGTILGPGTTQIASTASVDLANLTGFALLDQRTIENDGAVTYNAGLFGLRMSNGAIWNNRNGASFTITGDGAIESPSGVNAFNNLSGATVAKNGGASGTRFDVILTNAGTISSNSPNGTIIVNNGGSMTAGSLVVSNSANIHFFNGTFAISGGVITGSPGVVTVLNNGQLSITDSVVCAAAFSISNGGVLDVAPLKVFAIDDFFWSGGLIQGGGQVRVAVSGLVTNAAPTTLSGGTALTIDNTLDYDADAINHLTINDTAQLSLGPTAVMSLRLDGILAGASTATIVNQGTLKKTVGTGTSRIDVRINSSAGAVGVTTAGFLHLKTGGGTGSLAGTLIDTGTGRIQFDGDYLIGAGSSFIGTGTVQIVSGIVSITPNVTIENLLLDGGALSGSGVVAINGGKWTGGDMDGGGTTSVNAGKTFEIATGTTKKLRRSLINNGTLLFQNLPAALTMENGATLTNNSLTELQMNTNFFCTCTPSTSRFHNTATGTLRQFNAAGTSNFLTVFDNDGDVDVETGILNLMNGGTHTGSFGVDAVTFLQFSGPGDTFSSASSIGGAGAVGFAGTNSVFAGTYTLTGANAKTIVQGNVTFNSNVSTPALELRSGTLGGTANVVIAGGGPVSSWQGGTIQGSGALTIASGAVVDLNTSSAVILVSGRTITNNGTINYTASVNPLTLGGGASIVNALTLDVQTDTAIAIGAGGGSITNNGTFTKTTATGTTSIAPAFTNTNLVDLTSGIVDFGGGFTQSAGLTKLNGGNMGGSSVALNGGTLSGNGTITADVTNGATLSPGTSPGAITISGNYTQTNAGTLAIDLGGTTPATQYDQLNVTGTATLNGTLNVAFFGGYIPTGGETYDVLNFASRSGDFAVKTLPVFPAGGSIEANYFPTKLQLAAVVTQTDLAVSQTDSGPALHNDTVTFTVTVTNNGPSTAAGVTLVDTLSNATFISATSTVGTCSGTGPINCNIGGLAPTQSAVITITATANSVGTITNNASVSSSTFDPDNSNNNAPTASIIVSPKADLGVTITDAIDPANPLQNVLYSVNVVNNGPDSAASASIAVSITNGSITSASGAPFTCSGTGASATCTSASLAPGSYVITVAAQAPAQGTMTLSATASSSTTDVPTTNNTASETTTINSFVDLTITKSGLTNATAGSGIVYTITVKNTGPSDAANVVVDDPTPAGLSFTGNSGACFTTFPCSLGTLTAGQTKVITSQWNVEPDTQGTAITNVATVSTTTADTAPGNNTATATTTVDCTNTTPTNLQPANGATVAADGTLSWNGTGSSYTVFLGPAGSGCTTQFATTTSTSVTYSLTPGTTYEWRVRSHLGNCAVQTSSCITFTTAQQCIAPQAPLARVVAQTTTDKTYAVEWDLVPGATRYELDEATNAAFTNAQTFQVTGLSKSFKHDVTEPTAFYYRVRAFNDCGVEAGPYSLAIRAVIVPLPSGDDPQDVNVPAGSTELIVQSLFVPGEPDQTLFFNATADRPWLTVRPASGVLTPNGVTLEVTADPRNLPNGTFTASVIVTFDEGSGIRTNASTKKTFPMAINLVTPVSPVPDKGATSQFAMIIPTVGHLGGINSQWQSDVRVTNAGFLPARYRLTFTPAAGTAHGVQQTIITVDAGATTALDDIISSWFGIGALGENASGMLEILPLDDAAVAAASTVASSRTYNVTANGTLGQFIPAIRYGGFIGKALENALPQILSLQQIAETGAYRTNVGIAEGSGEAASVLMRFFDGGGAKLLELPLELAGGEQRQMNAILAQHGFSVADGRVEVEVLGGTGKVTAYASVVDNLTNDPLLVSGTLLAQDGTTRWVLPGAASLDTAIAHWRTDMRVFNYGAAPQPATLTFFPAAGGAQASTEVLLEPGEVLTLDNIVKSTFGRDNAGGVVHLDTATNANLIVTGRTYNETAAGTYGQFIPAVTSAEATGIGGRTLHILQVEDSVRYRTNLGLAEVTGQPVTVEVQVWLPDSKVTPTVEVPLAANEFRQFGLRDLGLGSVYNARVTVRVIEGTGRVTAYGSVIDELTQDPTYVPAQ
ncbi:MAG TPA: hypothetical protein VEK79_11200 [Thermoanaerobaculia bacterium]|nr:hypothetical protein [Thermoanaerobaculia bacterium]